MGHNRRIWHIQSRMFKLVICSLLVASCLGAAPRPRRPRLDGRIVGGRDADISEVPHQVSFEYYGSHMCGGSIIGPNHVLTAGHCCDGMSESSVTMRAGTSKRGSGGSVHQAKNINGHPDFDYYNIDYDYCVIEVSPAFEYGKNVAPIELTDSEPSAGTIATVSGWGTTSSGGSLPTQLQLVEVPIVDRRKCNEAYSSYGGVTDRMICAGLDQGGKDSCQGDSGGPLVTGGKLSGIVSWGAGCASPGYPGVYANVEAQRSWIINNSK